jgi:hypothetical protein
VEVLTRLETGGDGDDVAAQLDVLHHHHAIRTRRQNASGKDANGGTRFHSAINRAASRRLANHPQRPAGVGCAERVTVDSAGRKRGQWLRSHDVLRQDAPGTIAQRNAL